MGTGRGVDEDRVAGSDPGAVVQRAALTPRRFIMRPISGSPAGNQLPVEGAAAAHRGRRTAAT